MIVIIQPWYISFQKHYGGGEIIYIRIVFQISIQMHQSFIKI